MKYIFMWLITVLGSYYLNYINGIRIFKDLADNGYRINIGKYTEFINKFSLDGEDNSNFLLFIPGINILYVFQRIMQYHEDRSMLLNQLNVMNVIEEMSKIEKMDYLRKKTFVNALMVNLKSARRVYITNCVKFGLNGEIGEIEYFIESKMFFSKIVIVESRGVATKMTIKEQENKVMEYLNALYGIFDDECEEVYEESLDEEIEIETKELSLSEQKKALEDLKEELLAKDEDKGRSYTKKL